MKTYTEDQRKEDIKNLKKLSNIGQIYRSKEFYRLHKNFSDTENILLKKISEFSRMDMAECRLRHISCIEEIGLDGAIEFLRDTIATFG